MSHRTPPHPPETETAAERGRRTTELVSVLMVGAATITTAWCAFQSTAWNGEETFRLAEAGVANRREQAAILQRGMYMNLDAGMFMQWVNADLAGDQRRAAYYAASFRPGLKRAFTEWLHDRQAGNLSGEAHPFGRPSYRPTEDRDDERQRARAARAMSDAERANRRGDRYILATVMFASVLFLASNARLFGRRKQTIMLVATAVLFLVTTVWVAAMPVLFGAQAVNVL